MDYKYLSCKGFFIDLVDRANKANIGNLSSVNSDVWDIISMLRGPDIVNAERLKWITVARLRAIVGLDYSRIDKNYEPLTPYEMKTRDYALNQSNAHFQEHWRRAVISVRKLYGYDLNTETKMPTAVPIGGEKKKTKVVKKARKKAVKHQRSKKARR